VFNKFHFQLLILLLAGTSYAQRPEMAVTTVARAYQSPDGAFSLEVPAGWKTRKEEGSNEVSFLLGNLTVSVGTVDTDQGETVERWIEASKLLLKEQCVTAEIQAEGKTTVAGAPGAFFTMYCPGPRLPTTVRESAALLNGKIFTFNITAPTLQLAPNQAAIDSMANSFRAGVEKHPEHADADYDARMKVLKDECAAGKYSQAECATKAAEIGADHARATGTSDAGTGQVFTVGPAVPTSYQDPAHRFSLDIPPGWTLTQSGENGEKGVMLRHESAWISINPRKDERLEETLDVYLKQAELAYTNLLQRKQGTLEINGHRAMTNSFTGVDKGGASRFVGITDIDLGKLNTVAIVWSGLQEDMAMVAGTVEKIQQGIW
jgi:uncharacterized protein YbdZ (MbtH family)